VVSRPKNPLTRSELWVLAVGLACLIALPLWNRTFAAAWPYFAVKSGARTIWITSQAQPETSKLDPWGEPWCYQPKAVTPAGVQWLVYSKGPNGKDEGNTGDDVDCRPDPRLDLLSMTAPMQLLWTPLILGYLLCWRRLVPTRGRLEPLLVVLLSIPGVATAIVTAGSLPAELEGTAFGEAKPQLVSLRLGIGGTLAAFWIMVAFWQRYRLQSADTHSLGSEGAG